MSDNKIGARPTTTGTNTTNATKATAPLEAKKSEAPDEEHPDAVSIRDVAESVGKDMILTALDPLHAIRTSLRVVDLGVELVGGGSGPGPLEKVKNLVNVHRAIDTLKPGEEVEIGRKLEVEVEGIEGEGEVKVSVERDADGYVVTLEQGGAIGASLGEDQLGHGFKVGGGGATGITGAVTFRVKTAEEAKALLDDGLMAMAAGVIAPGADTVGIVATAVANRAAIDSFSVAVDNSFAAEVGFDVPNLKKAKPTSGVGALAIEGETTASMGISWERGPPAVAYVDVAVSAEGGIGISAGNKNDGTAKAGSGVDLAEGTVTVRYAVDVGDDFDPDTLKTREGQQALLEKAKRSGDITVAFEGEAKVKGLVVTAEKSGSGSSVDAALTAFGAADVEVDVKKDTGDKLGGGIKGAGAEGGIELAFQKRENVSTADKKRVTG